ncbi:hypothetical protein [Moorella sp. Hama-1]|uniref:hypothetical protein n=1 Tax=Moorella sp. Hama-1 TaxID=2138101 RepID=UPI000D645A06|nr:hypothetical protein [Moorella sp. Hama-1]BCV22909.1 hypothetical protein hamaS1_29780 [Moorella sp. Hama-1]
MNNQIYNNQVHDTRTGFSLPDFITTYLNRAGAVVEPAGYGLFQVLLPEELVPVFGREELLLAFDYEVAGETPGSTFVSHGSPLLDTVVRLALDYGRQTALYWSGKLPATPRSLEERISARIEFRHCRPPRIEASWVAENIYYGFYFRCVFRSFEKTEAVIPVFIDGCRSLPAPAFTREAESLFLLEEPEYQASPAPIRPLADLYLVARQELGKLVQQQARPLQQTALRLQERELAKVRSYFAETEAEIRQKLAASSDPDKKARLKQQLAATQADQERRIKDTRARYQVEVDTRLDHLVAYHLPCVFVRLNLQHKTFNLAQTLIYNPLQGDIELPACPRCGRASNCLVPTAAGQLLCPECLK